MQNLNAGACNPKHRKKATILFLWWRLLVDYGLIFMYRETVFSLLPVLGTFVRSQLCMKGTHCWPLYLIHLVHASVSMSIPCCFTYYIFACKMFQSQRLFCFQLDPAQKFLDCSMELSLFEIHSYYFLFKHLGK